MGRKSSSKGQASSSSRPAETKRQGTRPILVGAVLVALIGLGVLAFRGGGTSPAGSAASAESAVADTAQGPQPDASIIAKAEAAAMLGPRTQEILPPIPFQAYAPPRPVEVVTAAYKFAAEHPEILSYVPCFCGCERSGHTGNGDCFVRQRDEEGDVVAWDEHGVECAVCIDVANRSRQMFESGASVGSIRTAIDKEFGAGSPSQMPTPHPPSHQH